MAGTSESIISAQQKVDEAAAICRREYYASSREEQTGFQLHYENSLEELDTARLDGVNKTIEEVMEYSYEASASGKEMGDAAEVLRFWNTVCIVNKARDAIEAAVSFEDFHNAFHGMNAGFAAAIEAMPNREAGWRFCVPVLEAIQADLIGFAAIHDRHTLCAEQARVHAENEAVEIKAVQGVLDQFLVNSRVQDDLPVDETDILVHNAAEKDL